MMLVIFGTPSGRAVSICHAAHPFQKACPKQRVGTAVMSWTVSVALHPLSFRYIPVVSNGIKFILNNRRSKGRKNASDQKYSGTAPDPCGKISWPANFFARFSTHASPLLADRNFASRCPAARRAGEGRRHRIGRGQNRFRQRAPGAITVAADW